MFRNKVQDGIKEFEQLRHAFKPADRPTDNRPPGRDNSGGPGQDHRPMANVTVTPAPSPQPPPQPAPAPQSAPTSPDNCSSIVSTGSIWQGSLKIEGSVRVDGQLSGEIDARDTAYIAEGAQVDAKVRASYVIIAGTFQGQVHCRERLEIMPSGRVKAELTTKLLVVHEGAFTEGQIHMSDGKGLVSGNHAPRLDRLTTTPPKPAPATTPVPSPVSADST